jgi:hypothetical protein
MRPVQGMTPSTRNCAQKTDMALVPTCLFQEWFYHNASGLHDQCNANIRHTICIHVRSHSHLGTIIKKTAVLKQKKGAERPQSNVKNKSKDGVHVAGAAWSPTKGAGRSLVKKRNRMLDRMRKRNSHSGAKTIYTNKGNIRHKGHRPQDVIISIFAAARTPEERPRLHALPHLPLTSAVFRWEQRQKH